MQVADLEATLAKCQSEFEQATNEKLRCQQEAETTAKTIELANRLVGGLASENVRWAESINEYRENEKTLPGQSYIQEQNRNSKSQTGIFSK